MIVAAFILFYCTSNHALRCVLKSWKRKNAIGFSEVHGDESMIRIQSMALEGNGINIISSAVSYSEVI